MKRFLSGYEQQKFLNAENMQGENRVGAPLPDPKLTWENLDGKQRRQIQKSFIADLTKEFATVMPNIDI